MNRNPLLQSVAVLVASWAAVSVIAACSPSAKQQGAQLAAQSSATPAAPVPVDPQAPAAKAGASLAQAKSIAVGRTEIGQITDTASNFYRFDNAFRVRDVAIVRLENLSSTLQPWFKIYDANRSGLIEIGDRNPGALSVEHALTLQPGKPIYVQVGGLSSSTGKYKLSVTPQHAFDALEPNEDILSASPARVGEDIAANIMDDQDSDWLHFTGAPQKPLMVTLENLSTTLRPDVRIYNSNKSEVTHQYDGTPGANLSFPLPPQAGTDFYVQVGYFAVSSAGKYKLSVK